MMEFLPRLRVMFRGEDPEVEAMLGFQKGKYMNYEHDFSLSLISV